MKITVSGVDQTPHLLLPFTSRRTLDKSLDTAVVSLYGLTQKTPYKPFTAVSVGDDDYILADDSVTEVIGKNRYTHTLTLIEKTKELERIVIGGKSFTVPQVTDYADGKTQANTYTVGDGTPAISLNRIMKSPVHPSTGETYNIPAPVYGSEALYSLMKARVETQGVTEGEAIASMDAEGTFAPAIEVYRGKQNGLIKISGQTVDVDDSAELVIQKTGISLGASFTVLASAGDVLVIRYSYYDGVVISEYTEIAVVPYVPESSAPTVADAVRSLLATAEPIREGDDPRYELQLTDEQSDKFNVHCPRFEFSPGRTLWECLAEIGDYVHAIPRLNGKYITFDDLGGTKYADRTNLGRPVRRVESMSQGDYNAALDTVAQNLIQMDDDDEGAISTPFAGAYISLRAATDTVRIAEGGADWVLPYPVGKLIRAVVPSITINGTETGERDITPYLFEASEYDALSNYSGNFPFSKTYAIRYSIGSDRIGGLWYKAQDSALNIVNALDTYSVINVLASAYGVGRQQVRDYFGGNYSSLMVRVTYLPLVTAEIRNYKPDFDFTGFTPVSPWNQSANRLSAPSLGEALRGQLAMQGTTSETVTFCVAEGVPVPDPGELWDDYTYIGTVTEQHFPRWRLVEIGLATTYNKLGARVEVGNAIRQYEIPAAEDRYISIHEFLRITDAPAASDAGAMATDAVPKSFAALLANGAGGHDINLARCRTYDESGEALSPILMLPVVSLAVGNSIMLSWRFLDNVRAGEKSTAPTTSGVKYRETDDVRIGDQWYSRFETMDIILAHAKGTTAPQEIANSFPEFSRNPSEHEAYMTTGSKRLIVKKDSAESIAFSYQLHTVSDISGLIIGSDFNRLSPLVREDMPVGTGNLYLFNHRIPVLTGTSETSDAIAHYPINIGDTSDFILIDDGGITYSSWAIIRSGRFLIGGNGKAPSKLYFSIKRRW